MRVLTATLVAAFVSTVCAANAAGWKVEKDNTRTIAEGCSLTSGFDFLCLEVGCGAKQEMTLHGLLTGEILEGDFELRIDGTPFPVSGRSHTFANAASRAELVGDLDAIVAAMKGGSMLVVHYPDLQLEPDFEKIPLRGSSKAIQKVEAACR